MGDWTPLRVSFVALTVLALAADGAFAGMAVKGGKPKAAETPQHKAYEECQHWLEKAWHAHLIPLPGAMAFVQTADGKFGELVNGPAWRRTSYEVKLALAHSLSCIAEKGGPDQLSFSFFDANDHSELAYFNGYEVKSR